MGPGCQIYLSNNKKIFGQKWFLNNKIKKDFPKFNFSLFSSGNVFDFVVQKSFLTKDFFVGAEINLTSRVHCILVLLGLILKSPSFASLVIIRREKDSFFMFLHSYHQNPQILLKLIILYHLNKFHMVKD